MKTTHAHAFQTLCRAGACGLPFSHERRHPVQGPLARDLCPARAAASLGAGLRQGRISRPACLPQSGRQLHRRGHHRQGTHSCQTQHRTHLRRTGASHRQREDPGSRHRTYSHTVGQSGPRGAHLHQFLQPMEQKGQPQKAPSDAYPPASAVPSVPCRRRGDLVQM